MSDRVKHAIIALSFFGIIFFRGVAENPVLSVLSCLVFLWSLGAYLYKKEKEQAQAPLGEHSLISKLKQWGFLYEGERWFFLPPLVGFCLLGITCTALFLSCATTSDSLHSQTSAFERGAGFFWLAVGIVGWLWESERKRKELEQATKLRVEEEAHRRQSEFSNNEYWPFVHTLNELKALYPVALLPPLIQGRVARFYEASEHLEAIRGNYDEAVSLYAQLRAELGQFLERTVDPSEPPQALLQQWQQRLTQAVKQELVFKGGLFLGTPQDTRGLAYQYNRPFLALSSPERFRHTYIIGKTGSGKSTLLKSLIAQDFPRNAGVIVISPENGLFDDLAALIPPQRVNDLLYFDPTDTTPPVIGFNPLHFEQGEDLTQKAQETYTIFCAALGDLGVTMEPLLQNAIYALLQHPSASLQDLDRLLYPQDASFRHELLRLPHLDEPTRKFWQDYDKSPYYKKSYDAVINRLNPFFRPPLVDIFSTPSFSFHHVLNERPTIFLANLSKLRGVQAQVVGQLLLAQLQQTLLRRDSQPEQRRIPSFLFIDEFQTYAATSEGALVELFNRARKYHMGVTLAHQVTADIPQKLRSVITGNVGTLITMQVSAEDAPFFTKELQLKDSDGHARPDLLQNLKTGQAFARTPALTAGVPLSISPVAPPESRNVSAYCQNLKKVSKLNFGQQPQAQANGHSDEAFTPPPPPEEESAQASSSTNARAKPRARKTSPPPPPPPDEEENFKM